MIELFKPLGELLAASPWTLRVLSSILLLLLVNHWTRKFLLAVFAAVLLLAVWSGHSAAAAFAIIGQRIGSANELFLFLFIFGIMVFSSQMAASGMMNRLSESVLALFSGRTAAALLPALIGFLPMPGGAQFSASLVDNTDKEKKLPPLLKAKINYWFRHVWEFWWPLYPGVVLAVEIAGLPTSLFVAATFPLSLFAILGGYVFMLRKIPTEVPPGSVKKKAIRAALRPLYPIAILLAGRVMLQNLFPLLSSEYKYFSILGGIACALLYLQLTAPLSLPAWKKIFLNVRIYKLLVLVAAVRIYGAFITAKLSDGISLAQHMQIEFETWGVPPLLIIVLLPFICGLTTGIGIGFVGASFPVVMGLLSPLAETADVLAAAAAAYGFGYIGMMLSPVHLCLLMTNSFFNTNITKVIVKLLKPTAVVAVGICICYILLSSSYFLKQGYFQLAMILTQRPIEKVILDKDLKPEYKQMLAVTPKVMEFAVSTIGLKESKNYTGYYETKGDALGYIVTAAPKLQLKSYEWKYPIVGAMPYKGFFNKNDAVREKGRLELRGLDTLIFKSPAWSTLGWFRDPVTAPMLKGGMVSYIETLIHESVHLSFYEKGEGDLNEQLASFVGAKGTEQFMLANDAVLFTNARALLEQEKKESASYLEFSRLMKEGGEEAEKIYGSAAADEQKLIMRKELFSKIKTGAAAVYPVIKRRSRWRVNNALLLQYRRYQKESDLFKKIWDKSAGSWPRFWQLTREMFKKQRLEKESAGS